MAERNEKISFNIFINDREAGKTISQLRQESRKLSNEINKNLIPGTKEYNEAVQRLRGLNDRIDAHRKKIRGIGGAWDSIKKEIRSFGAIALGALGAQQLFQGIDNLIQRNAQLDESYRDVAKTTGLTVEQVKVLSSELKKIDTKTSRKDLLALAEVAGKLGKTGEKEIVGFVNAADKINVALGKDLGGNIENTIRQLGKISQLFGVEAQFGTEDSLLKIGSSINSLGASSTANEEYLVEFTKRLGGVASQAGLTVDQVLGLAATLDQLGQTSETSTTALSQLLVKIGSEVETFAEIAGVSTETFSKLLEEDANAALIAVFEGSKTTKGGVEGLARTLDQLGIDGSRAAGVLGALSNNTELLKDQQKLAAEEFRKGTSIIDEFNVKNEGLAANLAKIQKAIAGKFINSGLVDGLERIVKAGANYLDVPISKKIDEERQEFIKLITQVQLAGDNQERRNKLLDDLLLKYPQYFKELSKEQLSNEELNKTLKKVNDQYLRRVLVAKIAEEQERAQERVKNTTDKLATSESKRLALLSKTRDFLVENRGYEFESLDTQEKILAAIQKEADKDNVGRILSRAVDLNARLNEAFRGVEASSNAAGLANLRYNQSLEATANALQLAKQEMPGFAKELDDLAIQITGDESIRNLDLYSNTDLALLGSDEALALLRTRFKGTKEEFQQFVNDLKGIKIVDDPSEVPEEEPTSSLSEDEAKAAAKAQQKVILEREEALRKLNETLAKYRQENELSQLESDERELQSIRDKYQVLIDEAKEYGRIVTDIELARDLELYEKGNEFYERDLAAYQEFIDAFTELDTAFREQKAATEADESLSLQLKNELELENLDTRYATLIEKLQSFRDQEIITEEEAEKELLKIKELYLKDKELIEKNYRLNKEKADQTAREKEITEEAKLRDAKIAIASSMASSLGSILTIIANDASDFAGFQKVLTLFEIGLSSAAGVAKAIEAGADAKWPLNLVAMASGVSAVLSGIAQARKLFSKTPEPPKYAEGGFTLFDNNSSTGMPSFKGGGYLAKPTLALAGEAGPEYIVPNWQLRQPKYANLVKVLEAGRRAKPFADGGITEGDFENATNTGVDSFNTNTNSTGTNDMVMLEMVSLMRKLNNRLDTPLEASINNNKLIDNQKRLEELDPNYQN